MYTDEKHPDGPGVQIYEVVPELEAYQRKPKRPVWRRIVRALLTITALTLIFHAFMPHSLCTRKVEHALKSAKPILTGTPGHIEKPKMKYTFGDISDFKIEQGSLGHGPLPSLTDVFGKVVVGSCEKAKNIAVKFEISVSDDKLWKDIKIEPKKHGIFFAADSLSIAKQFVNITAYVLVPARDDYKLSTFEVETKGLNIRLLPSFTTKVNGTYFETVSGNITSYGGRNDVEQSEYVSAKSVSGNLYGRFGLGKTLELKTVSGNIGVNVTDAPWDGVKAKLTTATVSGENRIQFADVLHARQLISKHVSVSGKLFIDYPDQWQGHLKATSVTGVIHVGGPNVQITKKLNDIKGRLIKALKGNGNCIAYLHSTGGDISIAVDGDSKNPEKGGDGDIEFE